MVKVFRISVDEDKHQELVDKAKAADMSIQAYCSEMALNGVVLKIDYEAINQHTKEISKIKTALNLMMKNLLESENVSEADIKWLIDKVNELTASETQFLRDMNKERKKLREIVRKEAAKKRI